MSKEFLNLFAEKDHPDSGKFIIPDEAYKRKQINKNLKFYCPDNECLDENRVLIVKKSSLDKCFFSHKGGYEHNANPETLLHKLAIKWFEGQGEFEIPACKNFAKQKIKLKASKTECEFRLYKNFIPDVKLEAQNGFQFAIEIIVTNAVSEEKRQIIQQFNLPVVSIDLQEFYKRNKKITQRPGLYQ